ncbi:MAG: hypothetical protein SVO01_09860, partial [Thermotogota bacterium]|nr:hypothetical protein [Thermotogota bacterium]
MKKPLVIHPLLFGIFPILFLFTYNLGQVSFSETLMPLAIVSGFTLLLLLLLSFIIKDARKAGIILSIFLVIFFSYGHIFNLLCPWNRIDHFIIHLFLIFTWGVLFIWATYCTVRAKRDLYNCTNILNIMTLSLVFISLINISIYKFKTRLSSKDIISTEEIRTNTIVEKEKTGTNIDIYYIILDRYGSTSTLKEFYDFDNSEFINYLTNKGFYIAFESRSNYLQTSQSLASSLNMKFINYLSEKVGKES